MDNPEPPRRPRWFVRWLSPLRWRFWTIVFPALLFVTLVGLFTWPGLVYDWKFSDKWGLTRSINNNFDADIATLQAGPLEFANCVSTRKEGHKFPSVDFRQGFCTLGPGLGYGWIVGFAHTDNDVAFMFNVEFNIEW